MKSLVSFDKEIGADGAKAQGALGVDGDQLKAQVSVSYPIAKIVEPAVKAVDSLLDKLEAAIPGDWDKPFVESAKQSFKDELVKALSEPQP